MGARCTPSVHLPSLTLTQLTSLGFSRSCPEVICILRSGSSDIIHMTGCPFFLHFHEIAYQKFFFRLRAPPETKTLHSQVCAFSSVRAITVSMESCSEVSQRLCHRQNLHCCIWCRHVHVGRENGLCRIGCPVQQREQTRRETRLLHHWCCLGVNHVLCKRYHV